MTLGRLVAVNEAGQRIGEDHGRARLTDHEVELMRRMHEEYPVGHPLHVGCRVLAAKFGVTKTLARKICAYKVRAQVAARWKRVK